MASSKLDPLHIEERPVESLTPRKTNPRTHSDKQIDQIAASIEEFGFTNPLLIDATGSVIAGHGRLRAAKQLGMATVPTILLEHLSETQIRALVIADNKLAELAGWDEDLLASELQDLTNIALEPESEFDLGVIGFDEAELARLLQQETDGATDDDAIPSNVKKRCEPGDLWQLGNHRLLCGSSMKRAQVKALMIGEKPSLLLSDPPYGVIFGSAQKNAIHGDLTQTAIPISFALALEFLSGNARIYLCGGSKNIDMYSALFDHHLQAQPHIIIWDKCQFVLRPNGYHSQYEMIFYGWKGAGGGKSFWFGDRKHSDVWTLQRDTERMHPTQKPVALFERAVGNSCEPGGVVYEPFAGSGTAVIACEKLGRKCYAMELSPSLLRCHSATLGTVHRGQGGAKKQRRED